MARQDDLESIRQRMSGSRFVLVDRPTLLHGRAEHAGQCPCGCESWSFDPEDVRIEAPDGSLDEVLEKFKEKHPSTAHQPIEARWDGKDAVLTVHAWARSAWLYQTIPGPQLLIDRWTGKRWLRAEQSELDGTLATFDRLVAKAERVYMPRRCYHEQLLALEARPKVKGIFGGVRGGKTQSLVEEAGDEWIVVGGRGVRLWWVAPEIADTMRAIRKMVTGEAIKGGRFGETRPALFDPLLIADYPKTLEQVKRRKPITLIDGTEIELRYAGRGEAKDAGNLKGDAPAWIGVDEGAEIQSSVAWHTMIQRTTDSGGRLTTATTPKVGSPLKHLIYDEGKDIAANDDVRLTGYVHLSMLSNPWIAPREAQWTIDTLMLEANGKDLLDQDVKGLWLTPGSKMWEHFEPDVHCIEWHRRDLWGYKLDGRELRPITDAVASGFFDRTTAPNLDRVGGQDFNLRGHCTAVIQIWCPDGLDASDHENWVVFVEDIVVKQGEPGVAARFLANQAGAKRNLEHDYFRGLAIACDSTGAQDRPASSLTGNVTAMFTQCDEFVRQGFDMRPCHRNENGKPTNPEKLAQQAILHNLMRRNDVGQDAPRYAAGEPGLRPSTRLLISKARCPELVKGLLEQSRNERGFLRKRSDTADDRLSDPVDALLYILWALFSDPVYYPSQTKILIG